MTTTSFALYNQERNDNTWTIYTKEKCGYCDKIKKLIENEDNIVIVKCDNELTTDESKSNFLNHVEKLVGYEYRTFPMVWYGDKFIGDYTDSLQFYNKNNKNNNSEIDDDF